MKYFVLIAALVMIGCQTGYNQDETESAKVIDINTPEMKKILEEKDVQLIDVRTQEEVDQGIIQGAQHYDFLNGDFEKAIDEFDKNKPLVVYCHSGGRSAKAANLLIDKGFTAVYNYKDGFSGWPE